MSTLRSRLRATTVAVAVIGVLAGGLAGTAAHAAGTGILSGSVVDPDGVPVSDVSVELARVGGGPVPNPVATDEDGEYTFPALDAGQYRVLFNTAIRDDLLSEWYDGVRSESDATPLTIADGGAATADATLQAAASVSGTVRSADSLDPVGDVEVTVLIQTADGDSWAGSTSTDADGHYEIGSLWPGTYRLQFDPSADFARFSTSFFALAEGATRSDPDTELETAGVVSGVVTGPGGLPVDQAQVVVYPAAGADEVDRATTNEAGEYQVTGLYGDFVVQFLAPVGSELGGQWWEGAGTRADATVVSLENTSAPGIDAQLTPGVSLSGTASDGFGGVADVSVYAYPTTCDTTVPAATARTDADGAYRLTGLAAGAYRVRVGDEATIGYAPKWRGGTTACASSTEIEVGSTPVTGADVLLGETLAGKVTGVSSAALAGVSVQAVPVSDDDAVPASVLTTSTGAFSLRGLPAGQYRIAFGATARPGRYLAEWWKDAATAATSTPVTVTAGTTPASLTATLALTPVTVATPAITGTPRVGVKLTASAAPTGTTYAYRWYAGGVAISGATSRTFTPGAAQRGTAITVRVTASRTGYASASKTSAPTSAVRTGILTAATPTISGTVKVGRKLTAKPGTWTAGTKFSYQWYANGKAISKATAATLTLKSTHKGKAITVKVTGKKSGYATVAKTSKATKKVG